MDRRAVPWLAAAALCFGLTGCIGGSGPPFANPIETAPTTLPPMTPKSTGCATDIREPERLLDLKTA